jgi:hypothetical protein
MTINNNNIFGAFTLGEVRSGQLTGEWLNKEAVANYAWFGGGTSAGGITSSIERINFSNDSATAIARSSLFANNSAHAATGNSNYGWFGGGSPGAATVDRIDFSNDSSTASVRGALSLARYSLAATGNSNYGWFGGGNISTSSSYSTIDRIDFSNDSAVTSVRSPLNSERRSLAATGNSNYGWFGGGYGPQGIVDTKSSLDRIDFSNDLTITSTRGSMSSARYRFAATGNSNFGWFGGGVAPGSPGFPSSIDRIDFSNDLSTANAIRSYFPASLSRYAAAATGNSNFGWFGGGAPTESSIQRVNFSNDSVSFAGPLLVGRRFLAATSGVLNIRRQRVGNFGWFGGGTNPLTNPTFITPVDRINFLNDSVTASVRGPLSAGRYQLAAAGNSNYGWFGGGSNPVTVSTVDRIDFSNDSGGVLVRGSLSSVRRSLTATGNSNYGWFGGGYTPGSPVSTVDRIDFSNDSATASVRGPLSLANFSSSATSGQARSSSTRLQKAGNYGWFGGGFIPGPTSVSVSTVDRVDFSNDSSTASIRGPLNVPVGIYRLAATGNSNYGWFGGGQNPASSLVNRIDFSNDSPTASIKGPLSSARYSLAAIGNSNYGWFGVGYSNSIFQSFSTVDRINFSNDSSTALVRGSLSLARYSLAATGNSNYGWFGGGRVPAASSLVNRIDFSNDSLTASVRGPLSAVRYALAATGNSNYGWFGGGSTGPISTVDRINFSNDSSTASVRGPLSSARDSLAATGNSNYGWFGGGQPAVSTVDRIDFSNDSSTASVRGSLSSARSNLAATSNTPIG